ncbi:unnamed protein product [Penicillium olsonii]|nr:unnamed protein product [Penicillium olsonii]CAG7922686.1 unnamed protein product [Penicillium olsonii]
MASLPSKRAESGYLGNSSGSSLLRSISDLIPHKESRSRRGNDEQSLITETASVASPSVPVNLADTATINSLIDAYFTWYNPAYPILHERTFRRECENRQQIHPRSTWHVIFFLVLAIGHWTVTEDAEQSHYYTAARSRMSMRMLESGTLLAVQAFLLMGNYLQKRDRPNTGYNFVGIAYRMALGLGLHREPPSGTATANTLLNERRRVVWWTVYCFDSGFSFTTGRPIMVSDSFIETKLPRNIDDSNIELNSILPAPTESPTSYSAIIAQSRLASIGNVVFSEILSSTSQSPWDLKISRSIDNQFKAWRLSLPCYFTAPNVPHWFQGPRAIVGWKEQNLRMMLWWGSKRLCSLPSDHEEAQNMCHFTAVETIQDISNFCRDNTDVLHAGLSWYATYFLFQAAVVLSIHHLRPTNPDHTALEHGSNELWLSSIIRSRDCLASLTRCNSAAARCLEVLERISDRLQPLDQSSTPAPGPEAQVDYQPVTLQQNEVPAGFDVPPALMTVDPTLQMLFEDTSWDKDLFEGLNGFPSTGEGEAFDYMPSNVDQTWLRSFDTAK